MVDTGKIPLFIHSSLGPAFSPAPAGHVQRKLLLGGSAGLVAALAVVYRDDPQQLPFDAASAAGPLVRLLDAETSHNFGLKAAAWGLFPRETRPDAPELAVTLWGRQFSNPIGEPLQIEGPAVRT